MTDLTPGELRTFGDRHNQERPALVWRLAAKLMAHRLDQRLADGQDHVRSPMLVAHAHAITRPGHRSDLARSVRRILDQCERRSTPPSLRIAPWRPSVLGVSPHLRLLADRLESDEAMSAPAVARLRLLLSDGLGPLYRPFGAVEITERVRAVLGETHHSTQRPWGGPPGSAA